MTAFLNIPEERMNELENSLKRTIMAANNEEHFQTLLIDLLTYIKPEEAFAMGGVFVLMTQELLKSKVAQFMRAS